MELKNYQLNLKKLVYGIPNANISYIYRRSYRKIINKQEEFKENIVLYYNRKKK